MQSKKNALAIMRALCAEIGPDDGVDPRLLKRQTRNRRTPDLRKTRQLCGQIRRALDLALATSTDPHLQSAWVVQVTPAPNASRLRVEVANDEVELCALQASLHLAAGWLRAEATQAIHRKRTPDLQLVATPEVSP